MKRIVKVVPAIFEMLLALTIIGLVYWHAVRTDYRSTFDNAANYGHSVHKETRKVNKMVFSL
ncbi:MAG: hypothetical protein RQ824_08800 [bacterium]|nr:hypothetical protein [bacterium]